MGLSDWLGLGKSVPETVKAVSDLYTTDKARIEATKDLVEVEQKPEIERIKVNQLLAASQQALTSGGLALICWTAGFLLLFYYLPQIAIYNYTWGKSCLSHNKCPPFPMRPDEIMNLIYVIYGYGLHSLVKKK